MFEKLKFIYFGLFYLTNQIKPDQFKFVFYFIQVGFYIEAIRVCHHLIEMICCI